MFDFYVYFCLLSGFIPYFGTQIWRSNMLKFSFTVSLPIDVKLIWNFACVVSTFSLIPCWTLSQGNSPLNQRFQADRELYANGPTLTENNSFQIVVERMAKCSSLLVLVVRPSVWPSFWLRKLLQFLNNFFFCYLVPIITSRDFNLIFRSKNTDWDTFRLRFCSKRGKLSLNDKKAIIFASLTSSCLIIVLWLPCLAEWWVRNGDSRNVSPCSQCVFKLKLNFSLFRCCSSKIIKVEKTRMQST